MADTGAMKKLLVLLLPLLACLTACDQLGIEDPAKVAAAKEAEGKAIGSACRHAMRAIEDCYALNPKAHKAAMFAGWKEMDEYMRENKLEGVAPQIARGASSQARPPADADSDADKGGDKGADKGPAKDKGH